MGSKKKPLTRYHAYPSLTKNLVTLCKYVYYANYDVRYLGDEEHLIVLFYDEAVTGTREHQGILDSLEVVDDRLDKLKNGGPAFVKFSDKDVARDEFGLHRLPSVVFFDNQIPVVYDGKLIGSGGGGSSGAMKRTGARGKSDVYAWIVEEIESDVIRLVSPDVLDRLVDRIDDLVVVFYDDAKRKHRMIIDDIETVDEEAEDSLAIVMVKVRNISLFVIFLFFEWV